MTSAADAAARAKLLVGGVVPLGGGRFRVGDDLVAVHITGATCTCPWFGRNRRAGTCQHIDAVSLAQQARAAAPAPIVLLEDSVRLEGARWLRARAEQVGGRVSVLLELFDGETLKVAASVRLHPHRVSDLIAMLGRVGYAAGVRR